MENTGKAVHVRKYGKITEIRLNGKSILGHILHQRSFLHYLPKLTYIVLTLNIYLSHELHHTLVILEHKIQFARSKIVRCSFI